MSVTALPALVSGLSEASKHRAVNPSPACPASLSAIQDLIVYLPPRRRKQGAAVLLCCCCVFVCLVSRACVRQRTVIVRGRGVALSHPAAHLPPLNSRTGIASSRPPLVTWAAIGGAELCGWRGTKVSGPLAQLGAQQQQLVQQLQAVQRQYLLQSGLHPGLHHHNGETSKYYTTRQSDTLACPRHHTRHHTAPSHQTFLPNTTHRAPRSLH
ncbi:hypothetical protein E2C01_005025 [Portunus trituberculatus]|uniref:Uncharacterized protein n=1 Tax=Portunus trituberculatus TaxID=210409 RepID=A0A5B7CT63_PORTR|nr:hypothetical protein [Portunus trituberculatus]